MAIGVLLICLVLALLTPGPLFAQQPPVGPAPGTTPTVLPVAPRSGLTPIRGATTGNPLTTPTVGVSAGTALPLSAATAVMTATPSAEASATPRPTAAPTTSAPVPSATPTADAARGNGQWVTNAQPMELWASPAPDALSLGRARPGSYFELTGAGSDTRLYVYNPRMQEFAWIDAAAVGSAVAPPASYAAAPQRLYAVNLPGRTLAFNVRSWPRVAADTRVREIAHNTSVFVTDAVRGEDGEVWYRIGEEEYLHASGVRLPKGPPQMYSGRWVDVDLNEPTLMTAYEDDRIVYTALALHGTILDQTPMGVHRIQRRVENETMDSATLGVPRDAQGGYFLQNVLYTQYFTGDGAAIHYNYWSTNFGYPGTHGCLGVNLEDAKWFWEWAGVGTVLHIHK
jgi:hypothetical protein